VSTGSVNYRPGGVSGGLSVSVAERDGGAQQLIAGHSGSRRRETYGAAWRTG
jgi:hypothetical protein